MTSKVTPALSGPALPDAPLEAMSRLDRRRGTGRRSPAPPAMICADSAPVCGRMRCMKKRAVVSLAR